MNRAYIDTVRLLLEVMPAVFATPRFVLKGGTALNLFVQDLPRLSVDLDVVLADHTLVRDAALAAIQTELTAVQQRLEAAGLTVEMSGRRDEDTKLFVRRGTALVKVEVNHVFRGSVLPPVRQQLVPAARDLFTTESSVTTLAVPELYGSKLVAAMDRQHPRDLFDVHYLFKGMGLAAPVVECFVCYLAGHNRPMHEVLFPREKRLDDVYENDFVGMTLAPVGLSILEESRRRLFAELPATLTSAHRRFLLGFLRAEPDWSLSSCSHLAELPAIRWKLENLRRLKRVSPVRFRQQAELLEQGFET